MQLCLCLCRRAANPARDAQARVAGGVCSLSTRSDGAELLVGARSGQLLRLALQDMTVSEVTHSHLAPITAVAFGTRRHVARGMPRHRRNRNRHSRGRGARPCSDVVATAAADGGVRLWDLSDYTVISEAHGPCAATCLAFASDGLLVAGWKDGALRVFDAADGVRRACPLPLYYAASVPYFLSR